MSLQPSNKGIDRTTTAPFLLRLFYRPHTPYNPSDFSIAPPDDTSNIPDYTSLLPASIRQNSVQIYTWPTCTLSELTSLLTSVLPEGVLPEPSAGTRLVYKLIFPDTRSQIGESGRGKWQDKTLGSVVIGEQYSTGEDYGRDGDEAMMNGSSTPPPTTAPPSFNLTGDADRSLADARFVIGDYVACTIYPPTSDGRVAPLPPQQSSGRSSRDPYVPPRGPPSANGHEPSRRGTYRGGYGGGRGGAPPMSDWRRGERPPGYGGGGGGYGSGGGYRGGRGGRPY
jgi:histone deacetylase complex subunit SAP18